MDFKSLVEQRYSVRGYLPTSVENEKIDYILECARLSPSACNKQPWHFYVIKNEPYLSAVRDSYGKPWFKEAPVYIIVTKNLNRVWRRETYDGIDSGDIDASIAAEHICLSTASLGLGTCWICNFDPEKLRIALPLEDGEEPVALFPIGYINKEQSPFVAKKRMEMDEVVSWL